MLALQAQDQVCHGLPEIELVQVVVGLLFEVFPDGLHSLFVCLEKTADDVSQGFRVPFPGSLGHELPQTGQVEQRRDLVNLLPARK